MKTLSPDPSSLTGLLLEWFPDPSPYRDRAISPDLLAELLPDKPDRLKHILGVTGLARDIESRLALEPGALELTAMAHDIGYAQALRRTGFHPLDGAIFLAHRGEDEAIIHAVLHHTGAREEARHLTAAAPFYGTARYTPTLLDDAVTFCDTQTSPTGQRITIEERIAEIEGRYGVGSIASNVMRTMEPEFARIRQHVTSLLAFPGGRACVCTAGGPGR